ncbi:MAG TPA: hypothetical protein ENK57_17660 [Polyangiaceae bacterium]|nr:hypothetical protein [Polyangiaceae bacterium]
MSPSSFPLTAIGLGLFVALATSGCGLPLNDGSEELSNSCESDDDCGKNAVCYESPSAQDKYCVSTKADLSGAIVQVDVPSGANYGQGTSHLLTPDLPLSGTQVGGYVIGNYDLKPPVLSEVTVGFVVDLASFPACEGAAMEVQLAPVGAPTGVSLTSYKTGAEEAAPKMQSVDGGQRLMMDNATLFVPAGTYDIYVRPAADSECDLPPTVLQDRVIESGQLEVGIEGGVPESVTGMVQGYDPAKLQDWTIDIVENRRGKRISTQHTFVGEDESFTLEFWPQLMNEEALDAVVRLVPKEGDAQLGTPTIFYKLEALDIFGTGEVVLDLSELSEASPVAVDGKVASPTGDLLPSQLVIRSNELLGGQLSGTASYKTSVETDADGKFELSLLPGKYDVIALPANDTYAATVDELTILSGEDQGGKTIEVQSKKALVGSARTATGDAAFGVPVSFTPTSPEASTFLKSELATSGTVSTSATAVTNADGGFDVALDPGDYNLSLQPAPASRLPWAVLSRLNVPAVENQSTPNLNVTISHPVVMSGRVVDPEGFAISDARIRVWLAPADPDPEDEQMPGVLQVAETVSDGSGRYTLLLPASITASTSQ